MIRIEKNVPLPPKRIGAPNPMYELVINQLEIGDSFVIPNKEGQTKVSNTWAVTAKKLGKRLEYRTIEGGYRFWRVQ